MRNREKTSEHKTKQRRDYFNVKNLYKNVVEKVVAPNNKTAKDKLTAGCLNQ